MGNENLPIGVFDSGVGGLSIWRELIKSLPNESVIYYADSDNCPYGPKSKDEIIRLASKATEFLIEKGCKIIIVACNTATAAAIDFLRSDYSIPFIGMEPAVKPAALDSKTKSIAVLATEGTFNGKLYNETSKRFASNVELNIQVGDKLVDIVEKGLIQQPETLAHLQKMIQPLIEKNIDHLVLGCTHYPFLLDQLKRVLPDHVKIIDPAAAVIKQTIRVLKQNSLLNKNPETPVYKFYSTGNFSTLEDLVTAITGKHYLIKKI